MDESASPQSCYATPAPLGPEEVRAKVAATAAARGESLTAVSEALGRNPAYLQQYIKRRSPKVLPEDARLALALSRYAWDCVPPHYQHDRLDDAICDARDRTTGKSPEIAQDAAGPVPGMSGAAREARQSALLRVLHRRTSRLVTRGRALK
jgi:hypothetical protein